MNKKRFKNKDGKYQIAELMLSLVNKGDQTRGLSRRTRETFQDVGSTKMRKRERERAVIKLREVYNSNFILGLYYVMALAN